MSLELQSLTAQSSIADLDQFAWTAICTWSNYTTINPIYNGLDYAELTRCFLWDKVARAIRKQINPDQFEFEQAILDRRLPPEVPTPHPNRLKVWIKRSLKSFAAWQDARSLRSARVLYVPRNHPTLETTIAALTQSIAVAAPAGTFNTPGLYSIRPPLLPDLPDLAYAKALHHGIINGLAAIGITLLDADVIALSHQITQLLCRTAQIETELSILRPAAILLFADNHFPVQSYVLVARKLAIPTIMLQHGLDCEQYCLDQAYADVISVWGTARLQRYQQDSTWQPALLHVNGNPNYDSFTLPDRLDLNGDYWLWATRPHCPEKCFAPSRTPQEGIEILAALLIALKQSPTARLMIKPHPLDDFDQYQSHIERHGLSDRVTVSSEPVRSLLPNAKAVISEDSTVGLEAMFFGKVVIHAHFARSNPVLPFVQYNAAFAGRSPEQLQASIQQAEQLTEQQQRTLFAGQRRFLQDYAGACDRQAQTRVLSMIQAVLNP